MMLDNIKKFFARIVKKNEKLPKSKDAAKERLHLVLMQDRANVSVDFLELMKQEIIDVIKKYIDIDEKEIDVRLTNKDNGDGTNGAPALYANIPILNIKSQPKKSTGKKTSTKAGQTKNTTQKTTTKSSTKADNKETVKTQNNTVKSETKEKPAKQNQKTKTSSNKSTKVQAKAGTDKKETKSKQTAKTK